MSEGNEEKLAVKPMDDPTVWDAVPAVQVQLVEIPAVWDAVPEPRADAIKDGRSAAPATLHKDEVSSLQRMNEEEMGFWMEVADLD
jgi:hypothetical protein